jgi:acetyl esterase/lipase
MSRFRVVVTSSSNPLRPYGWEIMDEGSDRCAMRSPERYRTSKDAWEAETGPLVSSGTIQLLSARSQSPGRRASPLHADLRGLPPLLIQCSSAEKLLDDSVRLAGAAANADVRG